MKWISVHFERVLIRFSMRLSHCSLTFCCAWACVILRAHFNTHLQIKFKVYVGAVKDVLRFCCDSDVAQDFPGFPNQNTRVLSGKRDHARKDLGPRLSHLTIKLNGLGIAAFL